MSLKAMAAVWEDSQARSNNRLVLLAIADIVGDDGIGSYHYRQESIAEKAGISIRTLQRCIAELIEADELRVDRESTRTTNCYTVVVAWKRATADAMSAQARADERKRDTRQTDVSVADDGAQHSDSGVNEGLPSVGLTTDDKLTCLTRQDFEGPPRSGLGATDVNLTRQIDGGKKATHDNVGGSDTPPGGVPDPFLIRSLSARATDDKLTCVATPPRQGSIIPRGGAVKWSQQMEKQHASCHPEVCHWRDGKVRICMPLGLVDAYARKLTALKLDDAIADVIAWARADAPPADYVAPGDTFAHWRIRWDLTRASVSSRRVNTNDEAIRVPGAAETDALIAEITGGRVQS